MAWQRIFTGIPAWMRRQRQQHRLRWAAFGVLIGIGIFVLPRTVFPWIGYQLVAPQGWHNVTPHGTINGIQYAVSHDDPGLILVCGSSMETSFLVRISWATRCWRTRDGGSQWTSTQAPPITSDYFHLITPRADAGTVFAFEDNIALHQQPPQALAVTHDGGATWRQVTRITGDIEDFVNVEDSLASGLYRNGKLYALISAPSQQKGAALQEFAFTTDDGKTWTRPERTPSQLRRAGWQVTGFAADYRIPNGWYRSLANSNAGARLEHSADDGQTWTSVGPTIRPDANSSKPFDAVTLATTPAQPRMLCAGDDGPWLAASSDGGYTWRGGASELDFSETDGLAPSPVQIGDDGACYHDYQYATGAVGSQQFSLHDVILHLSPQAQQSTAVPLESNVTLAILGLGHVPEWWYVPSGHSQSARIVIHANRYFLTLANFLTTEGQDASDDFLFWRSVP